MTKKSKDEIIRSLKFLVFSSAAGVIEMGSYALLKEFTAFGYWPAYLTALVLSVLFNFTVNRKFTFHAANSIPIAMLKVFGYYCAFTPLSAWFGDYLADTLLWNGYLVTAINMLANFVTEFLFTRFVVYRNAVDTAKH